MSFTRARHAGCVTGFGRTAVCFLTGWEPALVLRRRLHHRTIKTADTTDSTRGEITLYCTGSPCVFPLRPPGGYLPRRLFTGEIVNREGCLPRRQFTGKIVNRKGSLSVGYRKRHGTRIGSQSRFSGCPTSRDCPADEIRSPPAGWDSNEGASERIRRCTALEPNSVI